MNQFLTNSYCKMKYIYLENWREEQKLTSLGINTKLAVIDNESLTKRLCFNKKSSFKVIVENQYLTHSKNSMDFLSTKEISSLGIYRNVKLISNGNKTVSAQSFFPIRYLHGKERYIKILGNRSLGTRVLNSKRFKKQKLMYIVTNKYIHRFITYSYKSKNIYVDEIFPKDFSYDKLSLFQARRKKR